MIERNENLRWASNWLIAAGIYNLVWGAAVIIAPHWLFDLLGMERMLYPEIWQCVGMIVGVYGVGYLIASGDHRRHWPIVLVGLLGKVLGPIGFAMALGRDVFPPVFGLTIITNDLIWWIPFSMMLWDAARSRGELPEGPPPSLEDALSNAFDQNGVSLLSLNDESPVLVSLMRHSGCTFCREMLSDLSSRKDEAHRRGYSLAIVTMSSDDANAALASEFGLEDASWISDPERRVYRALELKRGTFLQLFGPRVFLGGLKAALRGNGIGRLDGDGFQLAGAFVIHHGRIVRAFRHKTAADRPDFGSLACELPSA